MKKILKDVILTTFSLFVVSVFLKGLKIGGGLDTYLIAGLLLKLGDYILRPLLSLITLPFNLLTLGLFSAVINAVILYIISFIYPKIQITDFKFEGLSIIDGLSIPSFYSPLILSYFLISAIIYIIVKAVNWLFDK